MPRIKLRGVRKSYGGGGPPTRSRISTSRSRDGEFMCLLGPSGCGKTTTLRMIAGLEHLSDGEIRVGPRVVDSVAAGVFVPPERREMGLVFQSYALWPHLTIERNTDFGLRLRKVPKAEREARVAQVMRTLGIEAYRDRYPSQLSGGQQQRVALARMLAVNPEVLLLDEPLSNLDARAAARDAGRAEAAARGVRHHDRLRHPRPVGGDDARHHDRGDEPGHGCSRSGTPNEIYDRPANRFVAQFVGNPPINMIDLTAENADSRRRRRRSFARYPGSRRAASIGIRPEAISDRPDAAQPAAEQPSPVMAEVTGILPTGGSWIVELETRWAASSS